MLAFPAQVRSVVGFVASVAVVVASVVVSAVASAVVVVSEVDMGRKDQDATSRAKISMRITQDPINLVATVVTAAFAWIAMAAAAAVEVVVMVTVTLNLSQASKLWFAM